jgi:hypothetical protein
VGENRDKNLHILIITGLSGAGKTQVMNCLEDMEYYCVDNLPPVLLTKFVELSLQSEGKIDKVALVIDARGGEFFSDLTRALDDLKQEQIPYEIQRIAPPSPAFQHLALAGSHSGGKEYAKRIARVSQYSH